MLKAEASCFSMMIQKMDISFPIFLLTGQGSLVQVPQWMPDILPLKCVLTAVYGCLLIGSIFLMLRPFISRRYASERRRARHASAYVCSRNISYQEATGIWEITRMDLWGSLLSNTSKRLRHLLISKFISPKSSTASRSYAAYWLSTSW